MIQLATQIEAVPITDTFPEGLEHENEQSDKDHDPITEQNEKSIED